ncbi:MAG: glycosyltransferase family 2 protein [Castellaniella sp.]|uniref:glycosyltransferase family 2 protein n=1 Tax=Castellaniella sp. TaxID=1955812 RepID=UPI003C7275D1
MLVDQVKLCVGIPVYNEVNYLARMLDSLKAQTCDDVKYLVCDNHSTDGSWELIRERCAGDARFVLYRHVENIGAAKNTEFLIDNSRSEYFMWLGAHDYISSGLLKESVECLDDCPDISLVAGKPFRFVGDSKPVFMPEAVYEFSPRRLERYLQSVRLLTNCTIFYSTIRRSSLEGMEFRRVRGLDHVILSHLLWYGDVRYLDNEIYFRRYFDDVRAVDYSQRITGNRDVLTMHDLVVYYLDDLQKLYRGDARILRHLENLVIGILADRYTLQSLHAPDDREYWMSRP